MKDAPPIPTAIWEQLVLAFSKPKKARKWIARWMDEHGVEAVYTEPVELYEELRAKVAGMKPRSRSGGSAP